MEDLHPLTSERRLPFHERLVQHFSEADQNLFKAFHVLLTICLGVCQACWRLLVRSGLQRLAASHSWQALVPETEHMRYFLSFRVIHCLVADSSLVLLYFYPSLPMLLCPGLLVLRPSPKWSSCSLQPLYVNRHMTITSISNNLLAGPPAQLFYRTRYDLLTFCLCCISHIQCVFCCLIFPFTVNYIFFGAFVRLSDFFVSPASSCLLCLFCFFI